MEDVDEPRWRIVKKEFFQQPHATVKCAAFHAPSNLLVVGFSNGLFGLYDLPEFNTIHLLRSVAYLPVIASETNPFAVSLKVISTSSRSTNPESGWRSDLRNMANC
jgi:hypothetical protein